MRATSACQRRDSVGYSAFRGTSYAQRWGVELKPCGVCVSATLTQALSRWERVWGGG